MMMELHSPNLIFDQQRANTSANPKSAHTTSQVSAWLSPLSYFLGLNFLPLFFRRIQVTGQENIPATGPVILAPTHRSRWDSLLLPYATGRCVTGRDLRFMVTKTECRGLQGWFIRRLGGFPVDTQHPSITSLRHAVELVEDGEMLVIFPEGGIRKGKLHPLKPGTARLALTAESSHPELGIRIVPIGINYSQPYPNWGTDVSIHIGSAIAVADYTNGCVKRDAKRLTSDLGHALQELIHHESEITHSAFAQMPNL
jgi:1-acyl-sn-glycerol-3-phosphate acyltransferase